MLDSEDLVVDVVGADRAITSTAQLVLLHVRPGVAQPHLQESLKVLSTHSGMTQAVGLGGCYCNDIQGWLQY